MLDEENNVDLMPDPVSSQIDGTDRSRYLGGSDLAATLGYSPWRTPLEVQMEKLGEIPPQLETDAMRRGTLLEPFIADAYALRFAKTLELAPFVQNPLYPFLGGHPDRVATDGTLVEIKTTGQMRGDYGAPESDEIPEYYQVQVQHYLGLTGLDNGDLVLLDLSGCDWTKLLNMLLAQDKTGLVRYVAECLARFCIKRNPRVIDFLVAHGAKWWTDHIVHMKRIEPKTASDCALQALAWADVKGKTLALNSYQRETFEHYLAARKERELWEKREDAYKTDIMAWMDEAQADTAIDPEQGGLVVATWKSNASNRIDLKRLRSEAPEIAAKFMQKGIERRFLVKGQKE